VNNSERITIYAVFVADVLLCSKGWFLCRKGWFFFSWQYKFYFCRLQAVLATLEFFFL